MLTSEMPPHPLAKPRLTSGPCSQFCHPFFLGHILTFALPLHLKPHIRGHSASTCPLPILVTLVIKRTKNNKKNPKALASTQDNLKLCINVRRCCEDTTEECVHLFFRHLSQQGRLSQGQECFPSSADSDSYVTFHVPTSPRVHYRKG